MVGLNFGTVFLNADGSRAGDTALYAAMHHLDHMIDFAGEDAVGLGSDFDGAPMPDGPSSAADLQALAARLVDHGFGEDLVRKILGQNWRDFLARYWGG